jgi:alpha-L-rhamnosidase
MNSFSHYAFGAVMEWAFRDLAGIDTRDPGYGMILFRPRIPSAASNPAGRPLDWVEAEYDGPRGRIASRWKRSPEGLVVKVTVPANAVAEIHLPAGEPAAVSEGGRPLAAGETPGVKAVRVADGLVIVEAGSGDYVFTVAGE